MFNAKLIAFIDLTTPRSGWGSTIIGGDKDVYPSYCFECSQNARLFAKPLCCFTQKFNTNASSVF